MIYMENKILILIKKDALIFKYSKVKQKNEEELLNTNVITDNELIFSDDYIKKNTKLLSSFVNELAVDNNVKKIIVENTKLATLIIKTLSKVPVIEELIIKKDDSITFTLTEEIIKLKNIKKVSCFHAPEYVIDYLDQNKIILESRNEIFFTSKFMLDNDLFQYSKIYYKKTLDITTPLDEIDIIDLTTFFKINKYLKIINLNNYNIDNIKKIIELINKNKCKNIKIIINSNITEEKDIIKLRELNKKNKNIVTIKIAYSKEYIKNNYLKQIILNTVKTISTLIIVVLLVALSYISINNYQSAEKNEKINEEITNIIEKEKAEEPEVVNKGAALINKLLTVNKDTIGWLKLENTNINYPVVQSIDNDYYLKHNYKDKKDHSGWVFADYRNNIEELDQNTIIYAHNRFQSNEMFGTLSNIKDEKWYTNKDNLTLTFNTLYADMKFEIFSFYSINKTSDYLTTNFKNEDNFLTFVEKIENRSKVKLKTTILPSDKIITLSTCLENNKRFVVHAKLITAEEE